MGRYTSSDIVPFVAHGVFDEYEGRHLEDNGWEWAAEGVEYGKRKRLYVHEWIKDDHKVYVLNVSPYASGGVFYITACADTREDLEFFLKDFNLDREIEEVDSVEQTT